MGREVRNFTRVIEGLTARVRESRKTEEHLRSRIRFLENQAEEADMIRESISLSQENDDMNARHRRYVEYAPRSFSRNFNPRNNRRSSDGKNM